nr:unnamed protein product [Callosobruchus chinensis]
MKHIQYTIKYELWRYYKFSNDISTTVDLFMDYFSTVYNNINVNQTPTFAFSSNVNLEVLLNMDALSGLQYNIPHTYLKSKEFRLNL